jgi:ASC-1-like (ASCH) protein
MKINFNLFQPALLLAAFFLFNPIFSQNEDVLYASVEEIHIIVLEPSFTSAKTNTKFGKKYHFLVAKAYFKLLAEAEKSERKLRIEYRQYATKSKKFELGDNQIFQNKLNIVFKKYNSHKAMLSGLKSWNLFSEDRTGDMFYFMRENEDRIFKMYQGKLPEKNMIKYLIYKLADLYHLEE